MARQTNVRKTLRGLAVRAEGLYWDLQNLFQSRNPVPGLPLCHWGEQERRPSVWTIFKLARGRVDGPGPPLESRPETPRPPLLQGLVQQVRARVARRKITALPWR